jgi:hypothetical protein
MKTVFGCCLLNGAMVAVCMARPECFQQRQVNTIQRRVARAFLVQKR